MHKHLIDRVAFEEFLESLAPNDRIGLSIDLETTNRRGAGFIAISIVPYCSDKNEVYREAAFMARVDIGTLVKYPDMFDPATLRWWMTEPVQDARDELFAVYSRDTRGKCQYNTSQIFAYEDVCKDVVLFMETIKRKCGVIEVLGNGAIFDIGKLEASLIQTGTVDGNSENPFPYAFWDIRDLREVIKAAALATGINVKHTVKLNGTAHKALDDADVQARQLVESENLLVESRKAFIKLRDATTSQEDAVKLIQELAKINGLEITIAAQKGVQNGN